MEVKTSYVNQYLYVGSINTKKGEIYIAYDYQRNKCMFYYRKKAPLGDYVYGTLDEKEQEKFDNIFNYNNEDILYNVNSLKDVVESIEEVNCLDETHKGILNSTIKVSLLRLINVFPKCNFENYRKRIGTLKYEVSYNKPDKKGETYFSRYENTIYIGIDSFNSPSALLKNVIHENFHVIGTTTTVDGKGNIRNEINKGTGFEDKRGFGKGINEGFIDYYSNVVIEQENENTFESLVAELVTMILNNNLVYDNTNANCSRLMKLSKNKNEVIALIKLLDNYYNIYNRCIEKEEGEDELSSEFKHNFIYEIEKKLIAFFFENLRINIKNHKYKSRKEIYERINSFKHKLIFEENIDETLKLKKEYIDLSKMDFLKETFVSEVRKIVSFVELFDESAKKISSFSKELKKVCLFTSKITDMYEIKDEGFRNDFKLRNDDNAFLIAEKINSNREFYFIKVNKHGRVEEMLYNNKQKIKDMEDSKIMEGIHLIDEVREKERRNHKDKTYSIYRAKDGRFGIGVVLNGDEKMLRKLKIENVEIPKDDFDDSIFDFSYLDKFIIPDIKL